MLPTVHAFRTPMVLPMGTASQIYRRQPPEFVDVVIEVPKGSILKLRPNGSLDYVMPCPCPFNYGSVKSVSMAPDGDPFDAIILGPGLPYGHSETCRVKGIIKFNDAGVVDNKLVCVLPSLQHKSCLDDLFKNSLLNTFGDSNQGAGKSFQPIYKDPSILDWLSLAATFTAYGPFKGFINALRQRQGQTEFIGWEIYD